jgi:hypothetical protein
MKCMVVITFLRNLVRVLDPSDHQRPLLVRPTRRSRVKGDGTDYRSILLVGDERSTCVCHVVTYVTYDYELN